MFYGGSNKVGKERVRFGRLRLEFRMVGDRNDPGMFGQFHHFKVLTGLGFSERTTPPSTNFAYTGNQFIAMTMPLFNLLRPIDLRNFRSAANLTFRLPRRTPSSEFVIFHQAEDRIFAGAIISVELASFRLKHSDHSRSWRSEYRARSEKGDTLFTGDLNCFDRAVDAPFAESAGDEDAIDIFKNLAGLTTGYISLSIRRMRTCVRLAIPAWSGAS